MLGKLLGAVSRGFHRSLLRTSKPQSTCCPCAPLDRALPEAGNFAQPPLAELGSLTRAPGRSALESSSEFLKSSFRIGTPDQGLERRPELRLANVTVTKAALCSVSHAVLRSWLQQPSVFRMAEAAREARPGGAPPSPGRRSSFLLGPGQSFP